MDVTRHRRRIAHAALAATALAAAVLLLLPPEQHSFYPSCPIHLYLGILCPGCGATRALAALLRGHLREALGLNPLFVVLLPCAAAFALLSYRRALRPVSFRWPQLPAPALYALLGITAAFTIVRNL